MKRITFLLLLTQVIGHAQRRLEMPVLGAPLPQSKFEVVSKIPTEKLARLPKELPSYNWSRQPRNFPLRALQMLLDQSAFAGTNISNLFPSPTNQNDGFRLASQDNQDYFMVTPAAGRITIQNTDRSREYPPPDAVPDFAATWDRALQLAEMFGVTTNEMERKPDGSIHVRKTENTTSHMGGSIKYKSRRSVTVFRSIDSFLARSMDEDKVELELGVNGRLLKFNFKWPNIEAISTKKTLALPQIIDRIKKGDVLADPLNEYPAGGIARVELTDFQVFYYVSTMLPYVRRSTAAQGPDIKPMIEFLATFKSKNGEETEGGVFAPLIESE
jgi:hypothetical protein